MNLSNINIMERMKYYHVPGLSLTIISDGQITRTENYGVLDVEHNHPVCDNSIFSACSISKFLTAMLVMKLTTEGIINIDENVNERFVSWKLTENDFTKVKNVTLRNLLSHQAGIIDPANSFSILKQDSKQPQTIALLNGITSYCDKPIEVKSEPESEFHYSDAGYCIVQQLIEDVTNKPFHQVMHEFILQPLEMNCSTVDYLSLNIGDGNISSGHHKDGSIVERKYPIYPYPAASGLWTTSNDLAKLVIELFESLKGKSKIGISPVVMKEMISSQFGKSWAGLGVFLEGSEEKLEVSSLGWGIGFQCMLVAYPHLEKAVIIMTNAELGVHQMDGLIGEIYRALIM